MKLISFLIALISAFGLYPLSGTVTETDRKNDVVMFETSSGHCFAFYGVEDWEIGDGVSAIMYDNGTPEIFDDVILSVRYFH